MVRSMSLSGPVLAPMIAEGLAGPIIAFLLIGLLILLARWVTSTPKRRRPTKRRPPKR